MFLQVCIRTTSDIEKRCGTCAFYNRECYVRVDEVPAHKLRCPARKEKPTVVDELHVPENVIQQIETERAFVRDHHWEKIEFWASTYNALDLIVLSKVAAKVRCH